MAQRRAKRVIKPRFERAVLPFQLEPVIDQKTGEILRDSIVEQRDRYDIEHPDMRITGYQRVDNLERLMKRGSTISLSHYQAGDRYRKDWELAFHSGLPARDYSKVNFGGASVNFPVAQSDALSRWKAAEEFVGPSLVPLLRFVVLENGLLKQWSIDHQVNPAVALGRLSAALDRLHEFYTYRRK